jgi:O-antigen/teichoic acid export membrane protein
MLIKHGIVYLLTRFGAGMLNFATILLYTHLLTPDQYGRYALLIAGTGLVSNVATGWLGEGILRFSNSHSLLPALLNTVRKLQAQVLLLATGLTILALFFVPSTEWRLLIGTGIGILWLQSTYDIRLNLFRAQLRPDWFLMAVLIRSVVVPIAGWSAISLGFGSLGAAVGYLTGLIVANGLPIDLLRRASASSSELARQLWRYGAPLSLNSLLLQVVHSSDRFLIAFFLGEGAAGIYAAVYDITQQTLALFLRSTANASVPLIFKAAIQNEEEKLSHYLRENLALLLAIGVFGTVMFWSIVPAIMSRLVAAGYQENLSLLMPIIAAATLVVGLRTHHFMLPLMIKERTFQATFSASFATLTNIALNLWLIPRTGLLGAAAATLASYTFLLAITIVQSQKLIPAVKSRKDIASILICGALVALIMRVLPSGGEWQVLLNGLVGGILYFVGILMLDVAGWRFRLWRRIKKLR